MLLGIILRYNLLSLVYLLFLVVLPYSPQLDPLHIGKICGYSRNIFDDFSCFFVYML